MNIKRLAEKLKIFFSYFKENQGSHISAPTYRVVEIIKEKNDEYSVKVQMTHKSLIFKAKPEELLTKDELVDQFSQRDIRTLTYLGYLGVNAPKYKILAKRLLKNDNKLIFAIQKKGESKVLTKTAKDLLKEKDIVKSLSPEDAHLVGYTTASESAAEERKQKEEARKYLENEQESEGKTNE